MTLQGWANHAVAVDTLVGSYEAIDEGQPVRLAKSTSNLFRIRDTTAAPGLDVSGLVGVIAIDPAAQTADVQGMCTYEDLVNETLRFGMIPYVIPQLRTITLGGAVTGLGIESTSFRNGLPHESVLELDILTGAGEVVTATPDNEHADLFAAFANSYGTLGYATRLRIRLERVPANVRLRHVRCGLDDLPSRIEQIVAERSYEGVRVDGLDGTVFSPDEAYLTLAEFTDERVESSDYAGMDIYYRSIAERATDALTMADYIWRWDTDWFWCSRPFGVQNPRVRRWWPRRYRRSDVYHRILGLENRFGVKAWIDRKQGKPPFERVIQDIEVPTAGLPEFLRWFDESIGMRPVWLCPLRLLDEGDGAREWPLYPLERGLTYVNVGFWGTVSIADGDADGDRNRRIEAKVHELGGHKSLYSDSYYDRATFDELYGGEAWAKVKTIYDPAGRLTGLYEKAVTNR